MASNETAPGLTASAPTGDAADAASAGAERTCILSGAQAPRDQLIRLAISPDGLVLPDPRAKAPGRGAWLGVDRATLDAAQAKGRLRGALARAFKGKPLTVPEDLGARIATALERAFLDRLGLEARAGQLLTGSDRIEDAARRGRVALLLHAADAGADGNRRLDQAWRAGRDEAGSGARGLVVPLKRTILAMALGRENVVHVAIVDRAAAKRVTDALARWLAFIGREGEAAPREDNAGATASPL
ncbi:DUF448 domain-containing protein [Sphingomonas morindae]|uniref:DUF448 domain-containing protein n=1 Tax=Sphingomonas morindae TaxID=1541170 RepID=A0ABY4X3D0_9SPHN|nr:DUF448 domain-containing protein [Sphingomonas morindae]USI71405.1 DUF448 domain-containing protein [Sphingomonas morindae]